MRKSGQKPRDRERARRPNATSEWGVKDQVPIKDMTQPQRIPRYLEPLPLRQTGSTDNFVRNFRSSNDFRPMRPHNTYSHNRIPGGFNNANHNNSVRFDNTSNNNNRNNNNKGIEAFIAVEKKGGGRRVSNRDIKASGAGGGAGGQFKPLKKVEEVGGIHLGDVKHAAHEIIVALLLRQKYLAGSLQSGFFPVTHRFLEKTFHNSKLSKDFDVPHMMWMAPEEFRQQEIFQFGDVNDPFSFELPKSQGYSLKMVDGVVHAYKDAAMTEEVDLNYCNREEFITDHEHLTKLVNNGTCKSFSWRRLKMLQAKFEMYSLNNDLKENEELKAVHYRDFYNVRKVDTHIHAAGSMNTKHFLTFVRNAFKTEGDRPVIQDKEKGLMTLNDILGELGIQADDITTDMLDMQTDRNTFQRFDRFNSKYNPMGNIHLRDVFIKVDNYVGGEYFANLLKEVMQNLEESRYQYAELRISIYGRSLDEWEKLAEWAVRNVMFSTQVRWIIQVPRIFNVFVQMKAVENFEEMMRNIFLPLFQATNSPEEYPNIHKFLQYVRGFDSVDDESKAEVELMESGVPQAQDYNLSHGENPCYAYYLYYMYANIRALNHFRRSRGMNTFTLRPHCGESGATHHLASAFMTSDNISHGLQLKHAPVLQYLYYLAQMGIAMSPLSNNMLFLEYNKNPLPQYLARGLCISVSTDDPLQFHYTKEPLMEEYSVGAQVWKLSKADLCELARNSVYMSSFAHDVKKAWIGDNYLSKEGSESNDRSKTNVPNSRMDYRHQTLVEELQTLTDTFLKN